MSIIIVAGRRMSGKTVFARALGRRLGETQTEVVEQNHFRLMEGESPKCFNMEGIRQMVATHLLMGGHNHLILVGQLLLADEDLRSVAERRYLVATAPDICLERWLASMIEGQYNFDRMEAEWLKEREVYCAHLQPFEHLATQRVDGQRVEVEAGLL